MSPWELAFRALYRLLRLLDPAIRAVQGAVGLGNVVELRVPGRRSGRPRSTLVGVLTSGDGLYVGHPNGAASWARDLLAAREAELIPSGREAIHVRAVPLDHGDERDRAIRATWRQHPFPGNVIYWLGRRHVFARGVYFRLEPGGPGPDAEER